MSLEETNLKTLVIQRDLPLDPAKNNIYIAFGNGLIDY